MCRIVRLKPKGAGKRQQDRGLSAEYPKPESLLGDFVPTNKILAFSWKPTGEGQYTIILGIQNSN